MIQLIAAVLVIVGLKLIYDVIRDRNILGPNTKPSKGEVININNAWVDLSQLPYKKRDRLLTMRESLLFDKITRILEDSPYVVFPKVRLVDILQLAVNAPNRPEYTQRVRERNVDLLICQKLELTPLAVLMYDNSISEDKKKAASDRFTRRVAEVAGLGYLTLNSSESSEDYEIVAALRKIGLEI